MNDQGDLFPSSGGGFHPDFSREQPTVWVRELLVLREFKPGEENVIRRINLHPGLNILWARPRVGVAPPRLGEAGVFGHASGKTTFCRLLRHILGEKRFGNDDLRSRIRDKFPASWVVGEVVLAGKPWVICRPLGIGPHPFVVRDASIEKLFASDLLREPLDAYLNELNRVAMEPLPVATFASSPEPIEWPHLVEWLARDQESRFAGLTDFRHTTSNSESPEMDVEDRHFLFRAVIGLINTQEQAELEKNKKLVLQKQSAEKRAPLLRYQAKVAYERLLEQLPGQHKDLTGELFLEAVRKSLNDEIGTLTAQIEAIVEPQELKDARQKLADAQADEQAQVNRIDEIREGIEGLEKELQVLRGELPQKELDDYWAKKNVGQKICLEPLARAIAMECPLAIGKKLPQEPGKAAVKIELNAEMLDNVLVNRRKELTQANQILTKRREGVSVARSDLNAKQKAMNEKRDVLVEKRTQLRTLSRQALQATQDETEAAKLETSLGTLEADIRRSLERQSKLREQQNQSLSDFNDAFARVTKAILGSEVNATVQFRGRQLEPKLNHRGDLTSAAIETVKILAFDLATLISSVEGRGLHPRFLLHDGPREADMAADLYQKLFLLAREMELAFGVERTPNFQYIITTTEPPPVDLQTEPWLIEPVLDASDKSGRLLGEDL